MTSDYCRRGVGVLGSVALGWVVLWAQPSGAAEAVAAAPQPLPIDGSIFAVVADDVDHDGRVDLIATNRSRETVQILYQKAPRQFEAGPAAKVLGFHANEFTRLPGLEPRYALSAEGQRALKIVAAGWQGGITGRRSIPLGRTLCGDDVLLAGLGDIAGRGALSGRNSDYPAKFPAGHG